MLSERQLEALLRIFEQRMQTVVDQYLADMGKHLKAIGQLLPSDVNRLVELKRINTNVDRIKREIAKASGQNIKDIETVFTAVAASDYEFMSQYYGEARQMPIRKNKAILRILQAQARVTAQEMVNLTQTTILSEGYRKAVDVAIQTAQAGVVDYNTAIRSALKEAAKEGLRVRYPKSGLTRRLDTAVRMNVLDGIRALNNDVLWQTGKEFGADGVELSAHALCAEDHLPYQGRQYSMEEFETIQMRLDRPIGMWNCKHTRHPILLGVSELTYSPEQLEQLRRNSSQEITIDGDTKTRYEWTQEQRRIETAIRQQNDVVTAAKAAGDDVSRLEAQGNITKLIRRYDHVSEAAGLETRYDRTVGYAVYKKTSNGLKTIRCDSIIYTGRGVHRKIVYAGIETEPMPTKQLQRIVKAFAAQGGCIQMDKDTDAYLRMRGVEGITYNANTVLLSTTPSRAAVFEELIHTAQWRMGELIDEPISKARAEVAAKEKLLRNAKSYGLTDGDIEITKRLLSQDIEYLNLLMEGERTDGRTEN